MIKDRSLKDLLYRHFRAQGWLAQLEVLVATSSRVSSRAIPITDIDVLGVRPTHDLQWDTVVGDCKTKKKESPVNRVLWARGLVEGVGASSAIVLLERRGRTDIELDHKLFADRNHVTLLQQADFEAYDRAINYPTGAGSFRAEIETIHYLISEFGKKFPELAPLRDFALTRAWTSQDRISLLRRTLGELRAARGEIDPRRPDHMALLFECCLVFSVAFAEVVGKVFRRHLQPEKRTELEEAVRIICWGGREHYELLEKLRSPTPEAESRIKPLALPEWPRFLELVRTALDAPRLTFHIPQIMRRVGAGLLSSDPDFGLTDVRNQQLLSLSLRVAEYVCRAAGVPKDAVEQIQNVFVSGLSVAVSPGPKALAEGPRQAYLFESKLVVQPLAQKGEDARSSGSDESTTVDGTAQDTPNQ